MASVTPDFWNKIMFWKRNEEDSRGNLSNDLTKWEYVLNEIKNIILWRNPINSFLCLLGANVLFWLLAHAQVKFYGVIFIALLVLTIHELWSQYSHSGIAIVGTDSGRESVASTSSSSGSRFSSVKEINGCFNDGLEMMKTACLKLKRFRQEQPGAFCIATCISFLMLSFIGRTISGGALLYILLMAVMIVPGTVIHLLPSHFLSGFVQFIYSSQKDTESDKEEEDYLPDTNKENLELLRLASDLQLSTKDDEDEESAKDYLLEQLSARTSDATESPFSKLSLYPESAMPSIDSSLDFLELDLNTEKGATGKKEDSDSSDGSDINFQSKHFNGDSSEEEEFSTGLKFNTEKEDKPETKEGMQGLFSAASVGLNLLSAGASILTSAVRPAPVREANRQERESSSDTDSFELISEEDV